jgi:hypothetical protein
LEICCKITKIIQNTGQKSKISFQNTIQNQKHTPKRTSFSPKGRAKKAEAVLNRLFQSESEKRLILDGVLVSNR